MAKQPNAYKKFVATAATATLVATALAPVASAAPVDSYKDVSKDYKDAVNYLLENGIAQGTSDTTFGTSNNISRGDAAVMIANALKLDTANAKDQGFQDVNSRVEGAVNAIVEAGIASGRTTAKFDPAAYITRQEMAKMLANAYKLTATEKAGFKDVNKNWIDYVSALKENGITLGKSETIFAPEQNLTRGEFALFVFRAENPDADLAIVDAVSVVNETTTTATLKVANKELTAKDFTVLVNGKEVTPTKVESDAKGEVYTITHASLKDTSGTVSVNGKQAAFNFVVVEPKVESVKAINAKQVEVKFATAVDEASVLEAAGTLKAGVFAFTTLDAKTITANSATGVLSEDGKTLTVKAAGTEVFEGRYDVTVDGAKDKAGKVIDKYVAKNVDFGKDTVAPTITATERISSNQVKVKFSEPVVFAAGALTAKYTDTSLTLDNSKVTVGGTALGSVASTATAPVSELVLNLSDADVKVDKDIVVKFNGVADTAGNLIAPQPAEITVVKQQADGVEPTISTVTQTGAKKFVIKFAKDLDGKIAAADVTVGGVATTAVKKVSASEYEFTTTANLKGLQTVEVAANKAVDLAGQKNTTALSKLVTFTEDATAPKATSKLVVGKDNKEYIELTFDKDVTAGAVTVAGSQVKDYITTSGISESVTAVYADGTGDNKKVLHVPLTAAPLAVEGAAYDLTIKSTAVKSIAGVNMADNSAKFTRGKDGQAPNVNTEVISNVVVAATNNNTLTATFTLPAGTTLDGTTATNVANYVIAGAEVESVSLASSGGTTTQIATLKLKEGSNTFTGVRNITVKNVKIAGSTKVMEPKTFTNVSLTENVRPTVTKSEVTKVQGAGVTVPEVPASVEITGTDKAKVSGTASDSTTTTTAATAYKVVDNGGTLQLQKVSDSSVVIADLSAGQTFNQGAVTFTIAGAADGDTFTVATVAKVPEVPGTSASTEVLLTFSEAVVAGSAVDFELFIDNAKVTSTTATTSAGANANQLKVKIDKALTTEDFAKGVQLKEATTLDIADTAGNLLKLDAPISLKLN